MGTLNQLESAFEKQQAKTTANPTDQGSTPDQDMYMEANLAMGGGWPGNGGLGSDPNMNIASITAYSIPNHATGTMTTYNDNGIENS